MRLLACLIIPFMGFLTNATQTNAQLSSDPPAHCVNRSADFYPYTGEPCKMDRAIAEKPMGMWSP
jgi:hypothetical protein